MRCGGRQPPTIGEGHRRRRGERRGGLLARRAVQGRVGRGVGGGHFCGAVDIHTDEDGDDRVGECERRDSDDDDCGDNFGGVGCECGDCHSQRLGNCSVADFDDDGFFVSWLWTRATPRWTMCSKNLLGGYQALEDIIDLADEKLSRWDCIAVQEVPALGTSTGAESAMLATVVGRPLAGRPEGASSLRLEGFDSYIRMVEAGTHWSLCLLGMGDYSMIVESMHLPTSWFAGA